MLVKIIKAGKPTYWYASHIGETFSVKRDMTGCLWIIDDPFISESYIDESESYIDEEDFSTVNQLPTAFQNNSNFEPIGFKFITQSGEFLIGTDEKRKDYYQWLCKKHPDGYYFTLRKLTEIEYKIFHEIASTASRNEEQ